MDRWAAHRGCPLSGWPGAEVGRWFDVAYRGGDSAASPVSRRSSSRAPGRAKINDWK
jgi:hypothetical protein